MYLVALAMPPYASFLLQESQSLLGAPYTLQLGAPVFFKLISYPPPPEDCAHADANSQVSATKSRVGIQTCSARVRPGMVMEMAEQHHTKALFFCQSGSANAAFPNIISYPKSPSDVLEDRSQHLIDGQPGGVH